MRKIILAEANDFFGDKYLLAYLPAKEEFASYMLSPKCNTVNGNYYSNFDKAVNQFRVRICSDEPETEINWQLKELLQG